MVSTPATEPLAGLFVNRALGEVLGRSQWHEITQDMISRFGNVTLDEDPLHVDPHWAKDHSPYGRTIAFGFLTVALLTRLLHEALGTQFVTDPANEGVYLNYGFDRLRLVAPVPAGSRIRGLFAFGGSQRDTRARQILKMDVTVEIEGVARPALVGRWLFVWLPPDSLA